MTGTALLVVELMIVVLDEHELAEDVWYTVCDGDFGVLEEELLLARTVHTVPFLLLLLRLQV